MSCPVMQYVAFLHQISRQYIHGSLCPACYLLSYMSLFCADGEAADGGTGNAGSAPMES